MSKPRRIMKEFTISEISAVDRPAQEHARFTIMKRAAGITAADIAKYVGPMMDSAATPKAETFAEVYARCEAQRRQWDANEKLWPLFSALEESLRSIAADGSLASSDKMTKIEASVTSFMDAVKAEMPDVEEELAKMLREHLASLRKDERNSDMADDPKKLADLEKSVADLTQQLAKANADKADAEALAKMTDAERSEMAKMSEEDKKKWMAMKSEDRAAKIAEKRAGDETFKMADGTEIRKSEVGATNFAVMKSQEERIAKQADDLKKAQEAAADAEFAKRADAEMKHLPGTPVQKAAVLKAAASMPEDVRKSFDTIVAAAEKMAQAGFQTLGHNGGREPAPDSATAELAAKAAEIRKSDSKLTDDQAMLKAIEANPSLYDRAEAEKRAAN